MLVVAVAAMIGGAVFAVPAIGHQAPAPRAVHVTAVKTPAGTAVTGLANLPDTKAKLSCAALAKGTHTVNGLSVKIAEYKTGTAGADDPEYCAVTGTISKYIGFEVLLPMKTWHGRYLQVGCGGLCGSIGLDAPQSTNFAALKDGYFMVASQDEGHSGQGTTWSTNGRQRVDFAYLSDHDLLEVAKGLAKKFYGTTPKYSYFDGCSQGGHQALTEAERYPKDFNGVLAGAAATIMTELNSVLHEYEFDAVDNASGQSILSETEANTVLQAAIKKCDAKVGLILDTAQCEDDFSVASVECTATKTTNCLTAAQVAAVNKVLVGPVDTEGQKLYPGGYSLASLDLWDNGTGPNIPATDGGTTTPSTFITAWLQFFAFEKNIGTSGVADEPFTKAEFEKIEKLAPFWDDTDPYLQPFQKAGGKLILWQGGGDWSIPTDSSVAFYQAVVKALGGIKNAQTFTRYYQLPQVGHCGGQGPDTYAGLQSVVSWVETGKAPGPLTATEYAAASTSGGGGGPGGPGASTSDLTDAIPALGEPSATKATRTLEIYPYPELPSYKGHGNVDAASSYVGKVSTAMEAPLKWAGSFNNTMIWCNATETSCKKREMPTT